MLKKVFTYLLCFCICLSLLSGLGLTQAATINEGIVTVGTIEAKTGDSVVVPITFTENPGIMALSISITYDSKYLEYVEDITGDILWDKLVVDHPNKNLIRYVSLDDMDSEVNGVLISIRFKIKDDAPMGLQKISIEYSSGDFCDQKLNRIMPEVVSGGIKIAYNGKNCSHKNYGEWTVAAKPTCDSHGFDQRICSDCGHTDLKETDAIGHEYSDKWTVDKEATPEEDGTMSRYCIRCNDYVDRITFPYKDVEDGKVDNEKGENPKDESYGEENFKEQNPDKELSPSKPPVKPNNNSNSSSNNNSSDKTGSSSSNSGTSSDKQNSNTASSGVNGNTASTPDTDADKDDKDSNTMGNIIESIVGGITEETPDTENEEITNQVAETTAAVIEKITEAVPEAEKIIEIYKTLFIFIFYILFI